MGDISTYARAKDYLLLAAVGLLITLAGILFTGDRGRVTRLETIADNHAARIEQQAGRISRLEEARLQEREEMRSRLARIEDKIDQLNGARRDL